MRREMLSSLPLDLLRHSLKFLSLSDIQSLDNSILSHDLRPFYLSALQGFEISVLADVTCSAKMIQWLSARQLLIRTLKVSSYSPSTLKALISQNQTSLQSFYFSCSEDSFMVSLNKCANLSTLSIDGSLITDEGIHHLLIDSDQQSLLGQRIECLSLSKCIRLTSYSIMLTANYCPQLLELLLSELEFITDSEISLLVQGCKGLRHIDVSGTSITDVSVREILLAYPTLHTFTLFNCRSVSSLAKAAVLQHVASCQIACDHHDLHVLGTRAIRKALSDEYHPPIDEVVSLGVIPRLIQFLASDNPVLQFEAAWSLTNISSGNTNHTLAVVEAGAVVPLIELLQSPHLNVLDQAAWALGNIAGEDVGCRDLLLSAGALIYLSSIEVEKETVMRNVTWAISNLCRGAPIPPVDAVRVAYPFLLRRIKETTDEDTLNNACWTISYLSDADNDRIQELIDIGFLDPILKLFATTENESLRTPCVRIIGNILSGDEHKVQLLLDSDILSIFHTHLHLPSELQFKKEIFWSVSNITAGSSEQLQYVLNIGILETIMKLSAFAPSELQKEAIFCLSNATYHATPDQMKHLIQIGVVEFLSGLIKETPIRMLSPVLEGLLNILRIEPNCLQLIEMRYLRRIHFLSQSREVSLLEVANNLVCYFPDSLVNEILAGDDREDEMELEATNSDEDVYHGEEEEDDDDEEEEEEEVISIQ